MSLKNKTVLITRQREQAEELINEVEGSGGRAVLFPTIRITPPESWQECDHALQHLERYEALVLSSINAVEKFLDRCQEKGVQSSLLQRLEIYAVGATTRGAIEARGHRVSFTPLAFSETSLIKYFSQKSVRGKRFLFPRGALGKENLIEALRERGAEVDAITVYNTLAPGWEGTDALWHRIISHEIDVVTFASPSAARNFVSMMPSGSLQHLREHTKIAVIGLTTEDAVRGLGLEADIVAKESTASGLVRAMDEYFT